MNKKKITKIILLIVVTLMVSATLIGCGGGSSDKSSGGGGEKVVTFARPEDVQFWDPHDHFNLVSWIIGRCIYDTLVERDENGKIVPALATEWKSSNDGKEWTFKLRQGVKFHNGEEFNAESVKVSLERFISSTPLRQKPLWVSLTGVEVVDPYTVTIKFSQPNGAVLSALTLTAMIPPKAYKEKGTKLFEHPIGSGPFEFVEWVQGQKITLKRFDGYWGKKPNVDKIVYLPIIEDSTRIAGVQTGNIDIADTIPPDQAKSLANDAKLEVIRNLSWDQIYLGFKCDKPPFNDKRVREAVSLGLNREEIVKQVLDGGRVATGLVPQGVLGFDNSAQPVKRDVEKAKKLLAEAGYNSEYKINLIAPQGWYPKTNEVLQAIKAQLAEIGMNVNINILDGAAFAEKRAAGNYDIYYTGGSHPGGDPDLYFYQRVHDDAMKSGYKNETLNALIEKGRQAIDPSMREDFYRQAQQIINSECAPMIFLYQMENIYLVRKGVTGAVFSGDKIVDLRYVNK
ncbi:ABC transporter substrate-binding protein [Neomoorella humiferrea]|uniref:ABC transporter substrate-binding protein n=1 Tax=Neomoorella humiferrea TaxID=676965 RepID=UPI003D8EDB4D